MALVLQLEIESAHRDVKLEHRRRLQAVKGRNTMIYGDLRHFMPQGRRVLRPKSVNVGASPLHDDLP